MSRRIGSASWGCNRRGLNASSTISSCRMATKAWTRTTTDSPKVGVLYKWSPQIDMFANYSGSYEPPTFGELTGGPNVTPLSAQKGKTFEVGTRGFLSAVQWADCVLPLRSRR